MGSFELTGARMSPLFGDESIIWPLPRDSPDEEVLFEQRIEQVTHGKLQVEHGEAREPHPKIDAKSQRGRAGA